MEVTAIAGDRDPLLHGVARGVSFPRRAAKHAFAVVQERFGRVVDGVDPFWFFAYYQHGLSELAVRDPGVDCRVFLWLDVAEEWVYLRVGNRSCAGGCYLAFSVPGFVTRGYRHDVAGYTIGASR